jgi:hypothetical protein
MGTLKNEINEIIIIIVNGNLYCALFTRCIIRAGWAQGLIKKNIKIVNRNKINIRKIRRDSSLSNSYTSRKDTQYVFASATRLHGAYP